MNGRGEDKDRNVLEASRRGDGECGYSWPQPRVEFPGATQRLASRGAPPPASAGTAGVVYLLFCGPMLEVDPRYLWRPSGAGFVATGPSRTALTSHAMFTFDEDRCSVHTGSGAEVTAALRKLAKTLCGQADPPTTPLANNAQAGTPHGRRPDPDNVRSDYGGAPLDQEGSR